MVVLYRTAREKSCCNGDRKGDVCPWRITPVCNTCNKQTCGKYVVLKWKSLAWTIIYPEHQIGRLSIGIEICLCLFFHILVEQVASIYKQKFAQNNILSLLSEMLLLLWENEISVTDTLNSSDNSVQANNYMWCGNFTFTGYGYCYL